MWNYQKKKTITCYCLLYFSSLSNVGFFYDEFSKNYEYTIDDICNVRFSERYTKPFQTKNENTYSRSYDIFILLWVYFLMFRKFKILIFNSWYTTDEILLFSNFADLFCDRIRRVDFHNWSWVCVSVTKNKIKYNVFQSCTYDHSLYQILSKCLCMMTQENKSL